MDLDIRVVDGKFVTGIYHKVGDLNFEVINYPFPQSNIHSMLGYTTSYSQLNLFFRLCNNTNGFLFWAKHSVSKLLKRGYMHSLLFKYFKRFCLACEIDEKYDEKNYNLQFSRMIKYSPSVSWDMNKVMGINAIVKICSVKITTIASNFKDIYMNKPPLPTDVSKAANSPISCISTTDIDDIEGSNSYSLNDIAMCSTLPSENIPPSVLLGDENLNNTYVSRDAQASCNLVAHFKLNKHIHPFGINNPKYHCYMNSVIQLLFSILRTISHNFQFNFSTEGSLSKFLFETAHSASSSTDVDALKFRLVQYDKFYGGQNRRMVQKVLWCS